MFDEDHYLGMWQAKRHQKQNYINTYEHYRESMPFAEGFTTIQLRPGTRDLLKELGHKGETYDAIIQRLVKNQKKN